MHNSQIENELHGSVVMVTGGAGYIGTGIIRELLKFDVKQIIALDDSVSHLQYLATEFLSQDSSRVKLIPGNVTNYQQMRKVFNEYCPEVVFHAASYQSITFMENSSSYSLEVNILGTKIMADLSGENRIKRFINLSSDVAVNPFSMLGASKRVGEMYVQALAQTKKYPTQFSSIRFGNLAAPGSQVMRLLKNEIAQGGPVFIPHKQAKYHLESLEDTCSLILEAGIFGCGGEILHLDLGEAVSHFDLAKSMAGKEVEISIRDSKTEEKLYSNADYNESDLNPTLNNNIKVVKSGKVDYQALKKQLNALPEKLDSGNRDEIIELLMYIVPEYISMNSEFGQDHTNI